MDSKAIVYSKKICMLGTFGVGKTSLVRRYVHRLFDDTYLSTIGVQIYQKQLSGLCSGLKARHGLKLIIWDLANIEAITPATRNYFNGAAGAIVVFDLTRPQTLKNNHHFLNTFLEINPVTKLVFAGNKLDLISDNSLSDQLLAAAAGIYDSPYLLTSAKTGDNVDTLFSSLGKLLLEC